MNLPSDTPKLPKWIFVLGDLALLGTAFFIAEQSAHPTEGAALIAIVSCVALAALVGCIPFVADYARKQDEALDNRQRAIEALSVTVAAASEQVAIAATGLQGISEAAQGNFSKSERLSREIVEKITGFDKALGEAKKEELSALKRLESLAAAVGSAAEQVATGAAGMKGVTEAAQDALGKAEKLSREIQDRIAALDRRLEEAGREGAESAAKLEAAARKFSKAAAEAAAGAARAAESAPAQAPERAQEPPASSAPVVDVPAPEPAAHAEVAPEPTAPAAVVDAPAPEPAAAPVEPAAEAPAPAAEPAPPPPAPRKRSPRKTPAQVPPPAEAAPAAEPPLAAAVEPAAEAPAPEPAGVASSGAPSPPASPQENPEPAVSADGATRLIVTAYIGIGNRLFIRGDGPGLAWDRGVPLTFISIGKWRWETSDATATVRFKLYKNDQVECSALGARSVEPGAQQELNAAF
jgi:uncharacterized protein YoxC